MKSNQIERTAKIILCLLLVSFSFQKAQAEDDTKPRIELDGVELFAGPRTNGVLTKMNIWGTVAASSSVQALPGVDEGTTVVNMQFTLTSVKKRQFRKDQKSTRTFAGTLNLIYEPGRNITWTVTNADIPREMRLLLSNGNITSKKARLVPNSRVDAGTDVVDILIQNPNQPSASPTGGIAQGEFRFR